MSDGSSGGILELTVVFDHAEAVGVIFECGRWKECSQPLFDSV